MKQRLTLLLLLGMAGACPAANAAEDYGDGDAAVRADFETERHSRRVRHALKELRGETWRLRFGALDDSEAEERYRQIHAGEWNDVSALRRLIRAGDVLGVRAVLRYSYRLSPYDLNSSRLSQDDELPLIVAAQVGNPEILGLLLQYPGIDINTRPESRVGTYESKGDVVIRESTGIQPETALDAAVSGCHDRAAALLLAQREVTWNSVFRREQPGINCIKPPVYDRMWEETCTRPESRLTLLGRAANKGCSDPMIQLLLARGVQPSMGDCRYFGKRIPACRDGVGRRSRSRKPDRGWFRRAFGAVFLTVMGGPAALVYGAAAGEASGN